MDLSGLSDEDLEHIDLLLVHIALYDGPGGQERGRRMCADTAPPVRQAALEVSDLSVRRRIRTVRKRIIVA